MASGRNSPSNFSDCSPGTRRSALLLGKAGCTLGGAGRGRGKADCPWEGSGSCRNGEGMGHRAKMFPGEVLYLQRRDSSADPCVTPSSHSMALQGVYCSSVVTAQPFLQARLGSCWAWGLPACTDTSPE